MNEVPLYRCFLLLLIISTPYVGQNLRLVCMRVPMLFECPNAAGRLETSPRYEGSRYLSNRWGLSIVVKSRRVGEGGGLGGGRHAVTAPGSRP